MATKDQIKYIHVLKSKLELPDEHYRDILASFGVSSSASQLFSVESANEMISALIRLAQEKGITIDNYDSVKSDTIELKKIYFRLKNSTGREHYATYGQLCKIMKMWFEVSVQKTNVEKYRALEKFISNKWSIDRLEWLPIDYVGRIIKTIGSMQQQKQQ